MMNPGIARLMQALMAQTQANPDAGFSPTMPAGLPGTAPTPAIPPAAPAMAPAPTMAPPGFVDRLRAGLTVPDSKIRHKNVTSRSFLRGLVSSFKGGPAASGRGAGGGRAGGVGAGGGRAPNPEYESARTDAQAALAEQRRARASEIAEPDPVEVDPYFEVKSDAWKALAEQRRASARRSDRAPVGRVGGRSGVGGGSKMTFAGERAALNSKYQSEKTRIKGAIQKHYGPVDGADATPEATAAWARKQQEVAAGYQRRLAEINERWGADIEGDDEPAPQPRRRATDGSDPAGLR